MLTGATVPPVTHMPLSHKPVLKPAAPPAATIVPLPVSRPPLSRNSGEMSVPPLILRVPAESVVPSKTSSV